MAEAMRPGEARGFPVNSSEAPFGAYLKPTRICPDSHPRAAYEKISADLAHELDLPVPPALLYLRDDCPSDEEHRNVVSLVVAEEIWRLSDVTSVPDPPWDLVRPAFEEASGIVALDTWIGNTDRNNSKNILLFPSKTARGYGAVFIDHAFSLNKDGRWGSGGWRNVRIPAMPTTMREATRGAPTTETLERIEDLGVGGVEEVVTRIPDEYMTESHKEVVIEGLIGRQGLLRSALNDAYDL